MFARNKEEEKKKKIINLLLFKYMIDYCYSNFECFHSYIVMNYDPVESISDNDMMEEFVKLSESIKGDILS